MTISIPDINGERPTRRRGARSVGRLIEVGDLVIGDPQHDSVRGQSDVVGHQVRGVTLQVVLKREGEELLFGTVHWERLGVKREVHLASVAPV